MQAGDIRIESISCSWFYVLVAQGIVDAGGAFSDNLLKYGVVHAAQQQHFLADLFIHVVVATLVTHECIKILYFRVNLPLNIPIFRDGHADVHHPSEAG